jgi:hypothetical protein
MDAAEEFLAKSAGVRGPFLYRGREGKIKLQITKDELQMIRGKASCILAACKIPLEVTHAIWV